MNFRLRDYILFPAAIYQHHKFLQESQYWSQEKRRAWTQERLYKTLQFSVNHVPYYKKTLGPFKPRFNLMIDKLDLSELPILTKDTVRKEFKALVADNLNDKRVRTDKTSGSTGAPMQFLLDNESDIKQFASIWRVLNWCGYKFGDKYASLDTTYEKKTKALTAYDLRQNCLHTPFVNLNKENIESYVKKLKRFNPALIKSYPSSLALACYWLKEKQINDFRPKAILTCAETFLDKQREIISEVLQCPVFDFYGQNERACLISTCEEGRYHIHEEYSFVELQNDVDDTGLGENSAQIITTSFDNFAMPLIRYQTNDRVLLNNAASCGCSRTYKTIAKIIGRIEDAIITPEGRKVTRMDVPFKYSPGIQEAQILQNNVNSIEVKIIKSSDFQQVDIDTLLHHLQQRLGDSMKINFHYVADIPLGPNGKKKFIVSKINKKL